MYHSLTTHLFVKGYLGCIHFGAIMNKAAMNILVQALCECKFSFLWNKCPRMHLLGSILIACLVLSENVNEANFRTKVSSSYDAFY